MSVEVTTASINYGLRRDAAEAVFFLFIGGPKKRGIFFFITKFVKNITNENILMDKHN